jgi:hypothetical protein
MADVCIMNGGLVGHCCELMGKHVYVWWNRLGIKNGGRQNFAAFPTFSRAVNKTPGN